MSISTDISKLITNKYFLYVVVFISAANVLAYLVTNKVNAIIFFALISLLTYQFSKNMAIILLISIVATNFLMANNIIKEGLENAVMPTATSTTASTTMNTLEDIMPDVKAAVDSLNQTGDVDKTKEDIKNNLTNISSTIEKPTDPNNLQLNQGTNESTELEGFGSKMSNNKSNGSRIDYSTTMEQAYDNLDKILGGDNISKLTEDTQRLMSQQQKLFDTMQNMAPMLDSAKSMLAGFDMKSLGNLASLASSIPGAVPDMDLLMGK